MNHGEFYMNKWKQSEQNDEFYKIVWQNETTQRVPLCAGIKNALYDDVSWAQPSFGKEINVLENFSNW